MSDRDKKGDKPLPIPANCSPIEYVIDGFTMVELSYVGIVGMIAFIIGGILFFRSENPLPSLFIIIFLIGGAVVFFRKDRYTENMIDKIRILSRNKNMPKKYDYEYVNIYENVKNPGLMEEVQHGKEK